MEHQRIIHGNLNQIISTSNKTEDKMEKDKAVKILCEKGLHAYNDRGIVMISLKDSTHSETSIKKLLKEIGYDSSFGIIGKGKAASTSKEEIIEEKSDILYDDDTKTDDINNESTFVEEESYQTFADDNEQLTFQW